MDFDLSSVMWYYSERKMFLVLEKCQGMKRRVVCKTDKRSWLNRFSPSREDAIPMTCKITRMVFSVINKAIHSNTEGENKKLKH